MDAFAQSTPTRLEVHNEFFLQIMRFGLVAGVLLAAMVALAYGGMGAGAWSYAWALSGLVVMLLVEPASGAQSQGALMTILGVCALHGRMKRAEGLS